MIKPKIILIIVIILVILVIAGAIILTIKTTLPGGEGQKETAEETTIPEEIYGFTAVIKEFENKTLVLEASIPLADSIKPIKKTVKATVTDNTKIAKLKFPEEVTDPDKPVYPEETLLKFNDLKMGDKIHLAAATNISDNIKNSTEFTITRIFIIEE